MQNSDGGGADEEGWRGASVEPETATVSEDFCAWLHCYEHHEHQLVMQSYSNETLSVN